MSSSFESSQRFLRPPDIGRIKRNQRRIAAQRVLVASRNMFVVVAGLAAVVWAYGHTRNHDRFAVKRIDIAGAIHTAPADVEAVTARYAGTNLFRLDIEGLQRDLRHLPWIAGVNVEKRLPDVLKVTVSERRPVALHFDGGSFRYVDAAGVPFAPLSTTVGDPDLAIVRSAAGPELRRCVALLEELRKSDPQVYARISEIRPIPPDGFALYDRDLGAVVYANASDLSAKWRTLYAITGAEGLGRSSVEYADLRFADRVVVKPATQGERHAQN